MHYLGVLAHQEGRHDVAAELIGRAIALNPNSPEAYNNLGLALNGNGRVGDAIDAYQSALALRPNYANAFYNLGDALRSTGNLDGAIAAYRQAIGLRPDFAEAHSNLGNALADKGQLDEAISSYRQAISIRPDFAQALNNLGNCLKDREQFADAIAAFTKAIDLNPSSAEFHLNLGSVFKALGRLDEGISETRKAIALKPQSHEAQSNLLFSLHYHAGFDAKMLAEELHRWGREHADPLRPSDEHDINERPRDPRPDRRLRIGYVSPDFREHVVGQNLLPLLSHHDRDKFEITCYAHVLAPDAMTKRLQQQADHWKNIVGVSNEEVARHVREDSIDILVDLALHTAQNRLLVFARKPAPVQVTWLAYCSSSGMSAMDYRLSDPYFDPPESDLSGYAEKTMRLPHTYWCYQPGGPAPEPTQTPAIDNGFITFGCLNNFAKVSAAAMDLWAKILVAIPTSRLILHAPLGDRQTEIAERFARGGVEKNRIRFVGNQPWQGYAQTYSQIDIALDPFPFGGGITTCDALWMGVPVVTLSGKTAVGRGGRSILSNIGLPELIAYTPDQYIQIAIDLARTTERLNNLRLSMRARMLASPLMDAPAFARDMEEAYREMWRAYCATAGRT